MSAEVHFSTANYIPMPCLHQWECAGGSGWPADASIPSSLQLYQVLQSLEEVLRDASSGNLLLL